MSVAKTHLNFPLSLDFLSFLTEREIGALKVVSKNERQRLNNLTVAFAAIKAVNALGIQSPNLPDRNDHFSKRGIKPNTSAYYHEIDGLRISLNWIRKVGSEIRDQLASNQDHWYLPYLPQDEVQYLKTEKDRKMLHVKTVSMMGRLFRVGQCGEMAAIAWCFIKKKYSDIKITHYILQNIQIQNANHEFLMIGEGLSAVICDPWLEKAYPEQFITSCLHNSMGTTYRTVLTRFNPKFEVLVPIEKVPL